MVVFGAGLYGSTNKHFSRDPPIFLILGWLNLELLIGQFQDRFQFGIQRELIDLCRLSTLNGQRARLLFNTGGLESVAQVANASPADIENLLQNCAPFESAKIIAEGESEKDAKQRKQTRTFWVTGRTGMTENEAANMIVEEARELVQRDLGIHITDWGPGMVSISISCQH